MNPLYRSTKRNMDGGSPSTSPFTPIPVDSQKDRATEVGQWPEIKMPTRNESQTPSDGRAPKDAPVADRKDNFSRSEGGRDALRRAQPYIAKQNRGPSGKA